MRKILKLSNKKSKTPLSEVSQLCSKFKENNLIYYLKVGRLSTAENNRPNLFLTADILLSRCGCKFAALINL